MSITWHKLRGRSVIGALVICCAIATSTQACDENTLRDEAKIPADAITYLGFAKDQSGDAVPETLVTLALSATSDLVIHTNDLGSFTYSAGLKVDPDQFVFSCSSEGYKTVPAQKLKSAADPHTVLVICSMQLN